MRSHAGDYLVAVVLCFLLMLLPGLSIAQSLPAIFVADQRATLSAERAAVLQKLAVRVGDKVAAGELLAVFDSSDIDRDLATNRAQRNYLLDEIKATERLTQQGMANAGELARLKKDADIALASILWLKEQAKRATLKAPFAGTVVELQAHAHEWMQAGQPLLTLLADSELSLASSVLEEHASALRVGTVYQATIVALDSPIKAKLTAILPQVDVQSGTVEIRLKPQFTQQQQSRVYPGMKALLSFEAAP